jgi:hypothetical protein
MAASPIQVYVVEAVSDHGEKELVVQLQIACPACGEVRLVVHGHHIRGLRDILIDLLDQFPYLDDGGKVVRTTQEQFTITATQAKKARES